MELAFAAMMSAGPKVQDGLAEEEVKQLRTWSSMVTGEFYDQK